MEEYGAGQEEYGSGGEMCLLFTMAPQNKAGEIGLGNQAKGIVIEKLKSSRGKATGYKRFLGVSQRLP